MPSYGAITAAYQGTVAVTLDLLPYTLPSGAGISPGLAWIADEPIATSGVYVNGAGTIVEGLQTWFLTKSGYTTLDIGVQVTGSNVVQAWSGGNWCQWNGVNTLSVAFTFGASETGHSLIGSFTAGTLGPVAMTATALPAWTGVSQGSYPIKWQGVSYMLQALEYGTIGAGSAVLGHADGTTSIAIVFPGTDLTQSQESPACYPDTGDGFNYFLQDGLAGDGVPSIIKVSSTNASAATYDKITLSNSGHNALFAGAFVTLPYVGPLGWGLLVTGGLILLSPDGTKYWFYTFTGASSGAATIIGDPSTWGEFTFFNVGVHIQADGTVWFGRIDTGSPRQLLVSTAPGAATVADLWFGTTSGFVDFTVIANRRKFIADNGGAQNLASDGSAPFVVAPQVFLTDTGTPASFATNNGRGGVFAVSGEALTAGTSKPPPSSQTVTTSVPNAGDGVLGDYASGKLYSFNINTVTDGGVARRWLRRWRALTKASEQAKRFAALQIAMQTGIEVPEGTTPHLVLRWSDDGGATWSDERIQPFGANGATAQTVKFNRLGATRRFRQSDRIFELSSTDPAPVVIIWAEVDVS
jgi:hypothetical protein